MQGAGTQFDSKVVAVLLEALDNDEELNATLAAAMASNS